MSEKSPAAFVGLGVMGYPMAGHLAAKGHPMRVYNRTFSKSAQWVQEHGSDRSASTHPTPAEAAEGADYVMTCVGNDDDLRSVVLGENGVFSGMMEGSVLIDHTTTSAVVARELANEAEKRGLGFLDAPVSGGQAGAENGVLTIMVGGDVATFNAAESVMECYGKTVMRMGDAGAGQLTKMVNQICIAGLVQGLSEGMNFAIAAGLDAKRAAEVMSGGPRSRGRWIIGLARWSTVSSSSASPLIGCVKTSGSASKKPHATARNCPSPRWSTVSMAKFRAEAATASTRPA